MLCKLSFIICLVAGVASRYSNELRSGSNLLIDAARKLEMLNEPAPAGPPGPVLIAADEAYATLDAFMDQEDAAKAASEEAEETEEQLRARLLAIWFELFTVDGHIASGAVDKSVYWLALTNIKNLGIGKSIFSGHVRSLFVPQGFVGIISTSVAARLQIDAIYTCGCSRCQTLIAIEHAADPIVMLSHVDSLVPMEMFHFMSTQAARRWCLYTMGPQGGDEPGDREYVLEMMKLLFGAEDTDCKAIGDSLSLDLYLAKGSGVPTYLSVNDHTSPNILPEVMEKIVKKTSSKVTPKDAGFAFQNKYLFDTSGITNNEKPGTVMSAYLRDPVTVDDIEERLTDLTAEQRAGLETILNGAQGFMFGTYGVMAFP